MFRWVPTSVSLLHPAAFWPLEGKEGTVSQAGRTGLAAYLFTHSGPVEVAVLPPWWATAMETGTSLTSPLGPSQVSYALSVNSGGPRHSPGTSVPWTQTQDPASLSWRNSLALESGAGHLLPPSCSQATHGE